MCYFLKRLLGFSERPLTEYIRSTNLFVGNMEIKTITVGAFAMNAYLVIDDHVNEAFYIDPGGESKKLIDLVQKLEVELKFIINTHCHIDHIL